MNLSRQQTLLIVLVSVAVILYLVFRDPIKNQGALALDNVQAAPKNIDITSVPQEAQNEEIPIADEEEDRIRRKFNSKNRSKDGSYKNSNYADGERGNGSADFDQFFDQHNSLIKDGQTATNEFAPNDESGPLASYKPGRKQKISDEDIFKAEDYLPQEQNKDWFEVMPEPISVKNRHLINVTRPVGVNTVGNSHRNMSYDIRGTPVAPKMVVSPWLQSSLEPDTNLKGLC